MSRVGEKPVEVPSGVSVTVSDQSVHATGPKGSLSVAFHPMMAVTHDSDAKAIVVSRPDDSRESRALHGLTRSLINNLVIGVAGGFQKKLEIVGVGYSAKLQGQKIVLQIGFCHPVEIVPPEGIEAEVPDPTHIVVRGIDKQLVGQFAADIRKIRPPEPYKGKGIRYEGEVVRRKAGKSFTSAAS